MILINSKTSNVNLNYFKPFLCILGLFLFTFGCQKGDTLIPEEEAQIESLKAFNLAHHNQFIRDNMVENIAIAIKEYGQKLGYDLDDQYYEDIAWAGLQNTAAYDSLPNSRKTRIEFLVLAEKTNTNNNETTLNETAPCN